MLFFVFWRMGVFLVLCGILFWLFFVRFGVSGFVGVLDKLGDFG